MKECSIEVEARILWERLYHIFYEVKSLAVVSFLKEVISPLEVGKHYYKFIQPPVEVYRNCKDKCE